MLAWTGYYCDCNDANVAGNNRDAMEAALATLHGAVKVLDRWKLVPVEPTEEMRNAHKDAWASGSDAVWKAMLNAAPTTDAVKE